MRVEDFYLPLLLAVPVIAAAIVVFAKYQPGLSLVDRAFAWVDARYARVESLAGSWKKYVLWVALWPFHAVLQWTKAIADPFWQAGARLVAGAYLALAIGYLAFVLAYLAVIIVIGLLVIAAALFILSKAGGGDSDSSSAEPERAARPFAGDGTSRSQRGLLGDEYVEHRDENRNVVGRSRVRKGLFGQEYVEHEDANRNVVGRSYDRENLVGEHYVEHQDQNRDATGTSREQENLIGERYTEDRNEEREVVGESRERENLIGEKYTEHKSRK